MLSFVKYKPVTTTLSPSSNGRNQVVNNRSILRRTMTSTSLALRTPSESRFSKDYNFSSNVALRTQYLNPFGDLRFGMFLEELDVIAGVVAYRHACPDLDLSKISFVPTEDQPLEKSPLPFAAVTAACDNIKMFQRLDPNRDFIITGNLTWVGRSSMEVLLTVDAKSPSKGLEPAIQAYFTMVARDTSQEGSVPIPPLGLATHEEKTAFAEASERAVRRKQWKAASLRSRPPNEEERALIHDLLFTKVGQLPLYDTMVDGMIHVPMSSTELKQTNLMQIGYRNIYGKIFGGYLMRKAYELSFSTAYLFSHIVPVLQGIDDIHFIAPVEIGSIIEFSSIVTYTQVETERLQVEVTCDIIVPQTGKRITTNIFHYTFHCSGLNKNVVPKTYAESMKFLEGRRKLLAKRVEEMKW